MGLEIFFMCTLPFLRLKLNQSAISYVIDHVFTHLPVILALNLLAITQQVVQAGITWKQCAEVPCKFCHGISTVINGKVYYGGGASDDDDGEFNVYCYDPPQDNWTTLPPLPVRYRGLGQISGKLVAVGGEKRNHSSTNEMFIYNE